MSSTRAEKHRQDRIGDVISGRRQRGAAIAERALHLSQNVDRLGAAPICKPPRRSGIENAEPNGEDVGARPLKSCKIGILAARASRRRWILASTFGP